MRTRDPADALPTTRSSTAIIQIEVYAYLPRFGEITTFIHRLVPAVAIYHAST